MNTRSLLALALAASSAMTLAACGGSEPAADDTATNADATDTTDMTDMGPPPPADAADDGAGAMDGAAGGSMAADGAAPAGGMASIKTLNATCPGDIEFHADEGGPAYVNGNEADVAVSNENYYEAKGGGVTISVSSEAGANPTVSYSGPGGANGICQVS